LGKLLKRQKLSIFGNSKTFGTSKTYGAFRKRSELETSKAGGSFRRGHLPRITDFLKISLAGFRDYQ